MYRTWKRMLWGLTIGFSLYVFILFFYIQGNLLIFGESNFTYIGFLLFVMTAALDFTTTTLGIWQKPKNKVTKNDD